MKRLVIITVGKTHSGKTTFAKALEKELENSFVMDQDNNAEFINTFYKKLQPTEGPNTLKHSISKLLIEYAKEQTNLHFIISNSNRSRKDRSYLLDDLFNKKEFIRIIVPSIFQMIFSMNELVKANVVLVYLEVLIQISRRYLYDN